MTNLQERRTKYRFDPAGDDVDEGGSSHAHVDSGRELRPWGQKREVAEDIIEDEPFRVEPRHGKGPALESSSEEAVADIDEEEDDEAGSDDDKGDANAPATNRTRYPFGRGPTNNFGDGMTGKVKRLRATPRTSPKYTSQIQFS